MKKSQARTLMNVGALAVFTMTSNYRSSVATRNPAGGAQLRCRRLAGRRRGWIDLTGTRSWSQASYRARKSSSVDGLARGADPAFISPLRRSEDHMIIDCHAHVFQHWAGACGHPSSEIHRRYMQKVQTRTAARVLRARDGREGSGALLYRAGDNSWAGLADVDFRAGNYGRLDFTIDGEDYFSQYMPVGMQQIAAPPELMLAQMVYARVDHCVLQAG